ncbi:MAG: hypothetical protein NC218_11050 [Acetobacter sp.]|nr:hypothetical protein [Acetobacter sp.]
MDKIKLFFYGMAKGVLGLVYLMGLVLVLASMVLVWRDAEYLLTGLGWVGGLAYIYGGSGLLRHKKRAVCLMVILVGLVLVFGCKMFSSRLHPESDEDVCADLGVCSEKVISESECVVLKGKWRKVDEMGYCYMNWSVIQLEQGTEVR